MLEPSQLVASHAVHVTQTYSAIERLPTIQIALAHVRRQRADGLKRYSAALRDNSKDVLWAICR